MEDIDYYNKYSSRRYLQEFIDREDTIEEFVRHLDISEEYIAELMEYVGEAFDKQQVETHRDSVTLDLRLTQLRSQIRVNVDKIKIVSSETTIK